MRSEIARLRRVLDRRTRALRRARAALREGATTDPLTGLPLRGAVSTWLQTAGACLMVDLDGFKRINDEQGHLAGDRVLREIAQGLAGSLTATTRIARYGGDEFLVVVSSNSRDEALTVAEAMRASVRGNHLTLSVGIALSRLDESPETLLERADEALIRAKRSGRDRVEIDPD